MNYMLMILMSFGLQVYTPPKIEVAPIMDKPVIEDIIIEEAYTPEIVQVIEIKTDNEIIKTDYGYYKRWNDIYKCWDESEYPSFETKHEIKDNYDPNWLECTKLNNGCLFCFHPNQGAGNGIPDIKGEK